MGKYELVKSYQPIRGTYTLAIYFSGRCYKKIVAHSTAEVLLKEVWLRFACEIKNNTNAAAAIEDV
jgi:hypothetical protein